ncbi:uncharacterized protein K444DRAFT_615869 [Hyaloscypha bicolor E]|uniref:Uncharacterized protein n=1 Tax=Hyaloscypha bicolor E TaxID=1095630 RepID=A0A2J6T3C3_9HELO|nr:uncharacterized protein K444DRAFT_615869 [Hyaloscypha bicolor E]PMD57413.1 hypothetical protein K444DRAFT_615869 [Hyaloscypha bicolor E]
MAMPVLQKIDPSSYIGQGLSGPAYVTEMSEVEASICTPPCECTDCQHSFYASEEQYRPCFWYRGRVSDRDAEIIAARHIKDAEQERQYLLQRLASHADTIVNRWKKKSRAKRQALLAGAIPELYEHRWLIPRYSYMPESKRGGLEGRNWARRCQLLLPWLSLEVLKMNPAVFFALLHNRTAYPPQDWATFDGRQLILSWACGHFDVEYSGKCVIMYGPRYGELVDWQASSAHRADIVGFPKARLILEGQAYLMVVLRKIVDEILEGVNLNQPTTSEKWKLMTKLGFSHTNEVELWSPYTNQAFSAPPVFSIDNLISIVQIRLEAVGDHLCFLQTEPAYMRRNIKAHRQGEFHKAIKKDAAGAIVTTEIFRDILSYWRWDWIKTECEYVKSIHDRFRDSIHPGECLPSVYDRALGALELLLVNEVIDRARHIGKVTPQRPGFSQNWNFQWQPANGPTAFKVDRKRGVPVEQKDCFDKDRLEWCLIQMQGEPDKQTNYDHAMLFALLENHLAASNPKEKARVDEILYQKLSDLEACHEMLVSVRLHRPQNIAREIDEVERSENRVAWKGRKIPGYLTQDDCIRLGTALLENFYEAPSPSGQKNSLWISRSQFIRKALEAFWSGLRKNPKKVLEASGFSAEEVHASMEVISSNLTQEYLDSVQAEQQRILASIESTRVPAAVPAQKEWGSDTTTQHAAPLPKAKGKTRPAEQVRGVEEIDRAVAGITVNSSQDRTPKLQVKKRAYDMLSLMFPATAEESAKSIEWSTFVHAMSDMGFLARNGGGSAVLFESRDLAEGGATGGKIIFHKPHPIPKIDSIILHSMGKRMSKWFGWHRELFVLEL